MISRSEAMAWILVYLQKAIVSVGYDQSLQINVLPMNFDVKRLPS